ncbi:MAG: putative toxin-antitoxin system toxin component, PIN family [Lachnospiraceae bacterium]|nr:putative toxin-antitoxin system toxin component, PIN family [Lachnospiraceae bacterium]
MKFYAVYDTNVLISSLLSKHADSATVKVVDAISSGQVIPLFNQEILDEYDEVLHRARFSFSEEKVQKVLKMIRQFGLEVNPSPTGEILPDMDDLVFFEVVMEKSDDAYLITGNLKHYPSREFIVTPAEMMSIISPDETSKAP